jgi:hypothetical protein
MGTGNGTFADLPVRLVRLLLLVPVLGLPSLAATPAKRLHLPSPATIQVGDRTIVGDPGTDAEMCKAYTVTARDIRRYFRTYRIIDATEKHYLYQHFPCFISGTVTLRGKTFSWLANLGGTLETTFPDGIPKDLGTTDPAMLDTEAGNDD